jgi:hypothetical protein
LLILQGLPWLAVYTAPAFGWLRQERVLSAKKADCPKKKSI